MADPGEPKIIIDSDWKAQAQKEKERLAAKEREAAQSPKPGSGARPAGAMAGPAGGAGPGAGAGAGGPGMEEMPPADFQSLVGTLVTQALLYLGGFPDPQTGRAIVSLEHARFHIDLLAVLEEKTKGNLGAEEASDLSQALNELRLRFVEITKAVAQMQAKAAANQGGLGGMGGPGAMPGGGGDFNPNLRLRT